MDIRTSVDTVRSHLQLAAASGDEQTKQAASLLSAAVEPAMRIALQDTAAQLVEEISAQIAPGHVDLHLTSAGYDAIVVPPETSEAQHDGPPATDPLPTEAGESDEASNDSTARVSFRPPQHLKDRLEAAAAAEGLSLNAYLVRALATHLDAGGPGARGRRSGPGRVRGWYV